jgi:type II secretory pathway pseudopilin PulG
MQTALWITAGATALLALTSLVAVLTWRENRRRARERELRERAEQQQERTLEAARKEFAAKDDVGGLKSNLIFLGVVGGLVGAAIVWDKLDKLSGGEKGSQAR